MSHCYSCVHMFSVDVLCFLLQADALVNTTDQNLGFGGFVAKALLKAAGDTLKEECASKAPVPVGDVAVTGAGNMECKHVIHVVHPNYDGPGGQSEKVCLLFVLAFSVASVARCTCFVDNKRNSNELELSVLSRLVLSFISLFVLLGFVFDSAKVSKGVYKNETPINCHSFYWCW